MTHTWDLWYPDAAAAGLSFARARIDDQASVWVHAPPPHLSVVVTDEEGTEVARAYRLSQTNPDVPMTLLERHGYQVRREDRWPTAADCGAVVILPGGEAGTLVSWWNDGDKKEWRWRVEFYNHA